MKRKDRDYYENYNKDYISDGWGSTWSAWCPICKQRTMIIVRPGKCQCDNCE
jgi:hypothetical protein